MKWKYVILLYLLLFLAEQDIFICAFMYVYIFNMNIPKILLPNNLVLSGRGLGDAVSE